MQLHTIKRITPNKRSVNVGRGGKRGKTSGRGTKGQNSRAGRKKRPEIRDFIKRLPKLRGYAFNTINTKPFILNLDTLEAVYSSGETVNPSTIVAKGILGTFKGDNPRVKILATGEITKKLTVAECIVSAGAKTKIEKAGGIVK